MVENQLIYKVEKNIACFTINREKQRNALSPEVISLFLDCLDKAEKDEKVWAIIVTGSGDKAFCSGAELGKTIGGNSKDKGEKHGGISVLLKRLAGFPKPTVARVNGYCLAGGLGLMLACDIVIARDDARFGTPEVNVGLFPLMIGSLIFRNAPKKKAMEMIYSGRMLTASEADSMGMITKVVSADHFDDEVEKVLEMLSSKSAIGLKIGKKAFYKMADMPFEEAVDFLSEQLAEVASTQDAKEGITAFKEKRKPNFQGK